MKKHFLICLMPLFFFCCKKKEEVDTSPTGTPITNVSPADTSNYQALFSCVNVLSKTSGSFTPIGNQTAAYFSSTLIVNEIYSASSLQDMGTVSLNNFIFRNKSIVTNYYYNDTTNTQFVLPYNWNISGTGSINTFSYSNTNAPPTFTASANIPDSVSISAGFSIAIKGTTDCNIIRVFVLGGSGSTTFPSKLISGTDTIIKFTAADLQGITTTTAGYISVQLNRDHYRTISGKRINFRTGLQYFNSHLKVKP